MAATVTGPLPTQVHQRSPSNQRHFTPGDAGFALAHTSLKDPTTGQPLHYTPHDFRRISITDAVMSGLPPHIAQVIAGHKDINTTMGYKEPFPSRAEQGFAVL
jgi:integrase